MSNIQPCLCPPPLVDINKELILTKLNSSCSIREMVITTNPSVDNIATNIQPHLFHPLVDIDEKLIFSELNSPSGVGATATPFNVSVLSQPFSFFANANKDLTYFVDINTLLIYSGVEDGLAQDYFKGELSVSLTLMQLLPFKSLIDKDDKTKILPYLTLVVLVGGYILQLTVFSLAVGVLVRDSILQLIVFSLARIFKYLKVYISNQFIFLWKKTNCYKEFVNIFFIIAKLHLNNC